MKQLAILFTICILSLPAYATQVRGETATELMDRLVSEAASRKDIYEFNKVLCAESVVFWFLATINPDLIREVDEEVLYKMRKLSGECEEQGYYDH